MSRATSESSRLGAGPGLRHPVPPACRHTVGELAVNIARRPRRGRAELNQPVGQHEGMDVLDVTGSTVIVTGASSGIGAATARLLHKAGAHPVLAARRADRLAVLSEELDGALAVPTDVTDPTAVRRLAETTLDRHGRIDGLVNNAGVSLHTRPSTGSISTSSPACSSSTSSASWP
jgi:NADPH:quinone reductase-like Zn-dependent oxidoreductase